MGKAPSKGLVGYGWVWSNPTSKGGKSFADLVKESRQMGQDWDFVFVGCLSGQGDREPSDAEVTKALEVMVKSVQGGIIDHLLVYRPDGEQVRLRGPQI